ncbi:hypothetical protein TRAPUB_8392 [Trametes pubescens]|uniref:Uncharacterized protein n=1 Tax=Trametes pubescens TaxID=154538 RepID=A0A1M2W5B4_TRAPU|nr:hypothetical protein TRAPUB_8392 [Trametes pubescens]
MLELLSQCQTPALAELVVEFLADDRELDLWQFLPCAFPRLSSLTVNVYRTVEKHSDIPVATANDSGSRPMFTQLGSHYRRPFARSPSRPRSNPLPTPPGPMSAKSSGATFAERMTGGFTTMCLS